MQVGSSVGWSESRVTLHPLANHHFSHFVFLFWQTKRSVPSSYFIQKTARAKPPPSAAQNTSAKARLRPGHWAKCLGNFVDKAWLIVAHKISCLQLQTHNTKENQWSSLSTWKISWLHDGTCRKHSKTKATCGTLERSHPLKTCKNPWVEEVGAYEIWVCQSNTAWIAIHILLVKHVFFIFFTSKCLVSSALLQSLLRARVLQAPCSPTFGMPAIVDPTAGGNCQPFWITTSNANSKLHQWLSWDCHHYHLGFQTGKGHSHAKAAKRCRPHIPWPGIAAAFPADPPSPAVCLLASRLWWSPGQNTSSKQGATYLCTCSGICAAYHHLKLRKNENHQGGRYSSNLLFGRVYCQLGVVSLLPCHFRSPVALHIFWRHAPAGTRIFTRTSHCCGSETPERFQALAFFHSVRLLGDR